MSAKKPRPSVTVELYESKGRVHWRAKAGNNSVIATSADGYGETRKARAALDGLVHAIATGRLKIRDLIAEAHASKLLKAALRKAKAV